MLTPEEFVKDYPDDQLREELPDRPITTLRDIQYLYGKLYTLGAVGGGDYAPYLTPDAGKDLIDTPESLIIVRVDMAGDEAELADPPIRVTRMTEDQVEAVGHSQYPAGAGIDHSITHQSGQDCSPNTLAYHAKRTLSKWPSEEAVQAVAEKHPDGKILQRLAELGNDEDVLERIEEAVLQEIGGDRTALLTVAVRTEKDGDFLLPGEREVFQEAMKARKLSKLTSKGPASHASGQAACLLTGNEGKTVGTAEDPLNFYLTKQLEKFPGFDADRSWQTHSISEDAAVTIANAEPFLSVCRYRTRFGAMVYYLPYFYGQLKPRLARELYNILYHMLAADPDDHDTPVEQAYEQVKDLDDDLYDLRFYVAAILPHQKLRSDVLAESLQGRINHPVDLRNAHGQVLDMWSELGSHDGLPDWSAVLPLLDGWFPLDRSVDAQARLASIASGRYFFDTFPHLEGTDEPRDDDARIHALVSILSGEPLDVQHLLQQYTQRIIQDESDTFPDYLVASQYTQLTALARTGLLSGEETELPFIEQPTGNGDTTMTDDGPSTDDSIGAGAEARAKKLERFLEGTPALAEDPERRSGFLLGALIGHVGSYQRWQDVSLTVIDQHPVKGLSKANIKRRAQEVIDKDIVYSREENMGSTMYAEVVDRLRDSLLEADPSSWDIALEDLRFYYALGVTYGMNDSSAYEETEQRAEAIEA